MKNYTLIIIGILAALCACGCILLIVTILRTSDGNSTPFSSLLRSVARLTSQERSSDAIKVPDRFKEANEEIATSDSSVPLDTASTAPAAPALPAPKFTSTFRCNNKINASQMKQLLSGNDLFCKRSQWSKEWANRKGKGIRNRQEGLHFQDSVVSDTLTNLMWQRYATNKPITYNHITAVCAQMNSEKWHGFDNWRPPTIEELMALLTPKKNSTGLYLPEEWNCNAHDLWSCNPAHDSLGVTWVWVGRLSLGRCNYGRPDIKRAVLAVREM
jgi:hypothetical protein